MVITGIISFVAGFLISFLYFSNKFKKLSNKLAQSEILLNEKENNIKEKEKKIEKYETEIKNLESEILLVNKKLSENEGLLKEKEKSDEQNRNKIKEYEVKIENKEQEIIALKEKLANLSAENENLNKTLQEKAEEIKKLYETMKVEFENLSNKLLEEKAKKFTEQNKEIILNTLTPVKEYIERLKDIEKKIQTYYDNENKERASLKTIIETLNKRSEELEKTSEQLVKALTQEVKSQGIWGEFILEKILELSGLERGTHYNVQVKEDDKQPDVVIMLPDDKLIIIDSKVTLNSYISYTSANTQGEQEKYAQEIVNSLKNHITNLGNKNYETMFGGRSIDFVLMFVPIEQVMSIATKIFPEIFNYAINKKILIVTPSSLLVSLKTIYYMWKQDERRRNFEEILNNIKKLHEKLVTFSEHFQKIEDSIQKALETYNEAKKCLLTGKGNAISIIKNRIEPYIDSKKKIPENMYPIEDDENL